jgi:hypothetical protein
VLNQAASAFVGSCDPQGLVPDPSGLRGPTHLSLAHTELAGTLTVAPLTASLNDIQLVILGTPRNAPTARSS